MKLVQYEENKFWFKLKLSFFIVSTWWLVAFIELFTNVEFYYSLKPRNIQQLYGILSYPFVHGNLEHLTNNSLSGFIVFSALFLVHEKFSLRVLFIIYLLSGIILWLIGAENSMHIGASSIIYGVSFFLFFSGLIIRDNSNIALSLFMVAWYGSMIWGITPFTVEKGISWEGHLSGALVGVFLAFWLYKDKLKKTKDNIEIEEPDFHFFEKFPL